MLRRLLILTSAIVATFSLGCDKQRLIAKPNNTGGSTTFSPELVVENCGRKLRFKQPPHRVIATSDSTAELLLRIGAKTNIIGIYYDTSARKTGEIGERLAKIPRLSIDAPPIKEKALALNPDFVLAHFPTADLNPSRGGPSRDDYEAIGAEVFTFRSTFEHSAEATYEGFLKDVEDLGRIFDAFQNAKALTDDVRRRIAIVKKKVAGRPRVATTICFSANDQMLGVFGSGALNDLIEIAGGRNVYSRHKDTLVNISREDFALQPIECYVVVDVTHIPSLRAEKAADWLFSTFPQTIASQNRRYIEVDVRKMNLGLDSVEALEEMAKAFHPTAFGVAP